MSKGKFVLGAAVGAVAGVIAGILTAQLWVSENRKRIFTLHTFGKSYREIIMQTFVHESFIAIITVIIGAVISFVIRRPEIITVLSVSVIILILYCLSNFVAYHICTRQAFYKVATRNE